MSSFPFPRGFRKHPNRAARREFATRAALSGILALAFSLSPAGARPAHAMHPDAHAVVVGGLYGLAAGTVVGLATRPLTDTPRTVFMASSVGLYLGMALGVFYAIERDNPGNPLRRADALDRLPPTTAQLMASLHGIPGLRPAGRRPDEGRPALSFPVARF